MLKKTFRKHLLVSRREMFPAIFNTEIPLAIPSILASSAVVHPQAMARGVALNASFCLNLFDLVTFVFLCLQIYEIPFETFMFDSDDCFFWAHDSFPIDKSFSR